MIANLGRSSVLFTEDGELLTPEEAVTIAKRIYGYKSQGSLQKGPVKEKKKPRVLSLKVDRSIFVKET